MASAATGSQFSWTPEVYPVPVIPYGLDWNIQLAPDLQSPAEKLSDEEIARILPPVLKLNRMDIEYDFSHFGSPLSDSPVGPIAAILIGSAFLLAAYELIPRIHSQLLRFRMLS